MNLDQLPSTPLWVGKILEVKSWHYGVAQSQLPNKLIPFNQNRGSFCSQQASNRVAHICSLSEKATPSHIQPPGERWGRGGRRTLHLQTPSSISTKAGKNSTYLKKKKKDS